MELHLAVPGCNPRWGGPPPKEPWYVEYVLDIVREKSAILEETEGGHIFVFVLAGESVYCRFSIFTVLV